MSSVKSRSVEYVKIIEVNRKMDMQEVERASERKIDFAGFKLFGLITPLHTYIHTYILTGLGISRGAFAPKKGYKQGYEHVVET